MKDGWKELVIDASKSTRNIHSANPAIYAKTKTAKKRVFLSITFIYAQMLKERKAALIRERAMYCPDRDKGRKGYTKDQQDFISRLPPDQSVFKHCSKSIQRD